MILSVGEILVDMLGTYRGDTFSYERNAGGAPFNVACAVKKFGGSSAFVGNVGDDIVGKYLCDFAKNQDLDECYITVDKQLNTTLAFVELDKTGERSFCFYRKNTADYFLPTVPPEIIEKADIVNVGSLMISEDIGFDYAKDLIKRAKRKNKLVAFDVNYRTDIFCDANEAMARYKEIIVDADILKFSEDEVKIFTESYVNSLKNKLVLISLGGAGSRWLYNGQRHDVASIKVKPVDTTGAGDAFFAGVLVKLEQRPKDAWTAEWLDEVLHFGNVCGALNTQGTGAIANLPSITEIEKHLNMLK